MLAAGTVLGKRHGQCFHEFCTTTVPGARTWCTGLVGWTAPIRAVTSAMIPGYFWSQETLKTWVRATSERQPSPR